MTDQLTETLTRVCRRCSAQTSGDGAFCPHCGTSFTRRSRRPAKRTIALLMAAALVAAAGVGAVLAKRHSDEVAADRAAAAAADRREAAATAEAERQEAADDAERAVRAEAVEDLEANIVKHAKKLVRQGLFDGPIREASCTATGGGSTDDLTALTGTFDCMAIYKTHSDGTQTGYSYAGTIDWESGQMTWQYGG